MTGPTRRHPIKTPVVVVYATETGFSWRAEDFRGLHREESTSDEWYDWAEAFLDAINHGPEGALFSFELSPDSQFHGLDDKVLETMAYKPRRGLGEGLDKGEVL